MKTYHVESIGASFTAKGIPELGKHFTARSKEGWDLHSVFKVEQQTGCLNTGRPLVTYLAIYVSAD